MTTVKIKMNEAGLRELGAQIARKMESVDRQFRSRHGGKPESEIRPHVKRAFATVGVNLKDSQVQEYAAAVSAGRPYKWVVQ